MATTDCDLYRAIHSESPEFVKLDDVASGREDATGDGLLHARIAGGIQSGSDGTQFVQGPDVMLQRSGDDAPWYVATDGGTSMHDIPGWFGYTTWNYFCVPEGTEYCGETLFIKRDKKRKWNKTKTVRGRHYTIRPKTRMRLDTYFGALDNLARAAIVRSMALGKPVRLSSADDAGEGTSGSD
jgi:hypothetical protein